MLAFAAKKHFPGANGQKEEDASVFVHRVLIELSLAAS